MQTNAYGLMNLWQQGDAVTRTVAVFLLSMSVLSWSMIIIKSLQLNQVRKQAALADAGLSERTWTTWSSEENAEHSQAISPFKNMWQEGLKAVSYHKLHRRKLERSMNQNDWVSLSLRKCIDNTAQQLQADLPILASIGSTAPFVGLFGTVWGIYHALVRISASGQSSIDQIAGPVGESLIMTAFGLAVAIPAVLGYNFLLQGHKKILAQLRNFAHDLQVKLLVENSFPTFEDNELDDVETLNSRHLEQGVGV
jgi:biopolymer transport protein ExbB